VVGARPQNASFEDALELVWWRGLSLCTTPAQKLYKGQPMIAAHTTTELRRGGDDSHSAPGDHGHSLIFHHHLL